MRNNRIAEHTAHATHLHLLRAALASGARLGLAVDPVFKAVKKVSPKRGAVLPSRAVDRALLLVLGLVALWYCLRALKLSMKVALKVSWFALRKAMLFAVKLPMKLLFVTVRWVLYFLTCCCCCGQCQSKKKAQKASNAVEAQAKMATADEITTLLQRAKEKDKLEKAVKLFAKVAKKGTVMSKEFGDLVEGKKLEIVVLKQALSCNFKELDLKTLGL